ncbi:MAG: DUF4912 domain-containing protein [Methylococcales bacterium]|nr:DUF4912 domain-containing protein [Methylococcales bacterium]
MNENNVIERDTSLLMKNNFLKKQSLSRQELLDVSQNISLYYSSDKRCNNRKLTLLSVDPQHLYVYWGVENQQAVTPRALSREEKTNLVLQIYGQDEDENATIKKRTPIKEYVVKPSQKTQRIELSATKKEIYFATLVEKTQEGEIISLVTSNYTGGHQTTRLTSSYQTYTIADAVVRYFPLIDSAPKKVNIIDTVYSGVGWI